MSKTKIDYLTHTWNPTTGCSPVSEGCQNCWARALSKRFHGRDDKFEVQTYEDRLEYPLHLSKPARIGVCFQGDLFHRQVDDGFRRLVFAVMMACPQHTFVVLTKRAREMREWFQVYSPNDCFVEAKFINEGRRANHGSRLTAKLTCMDGLPSKNNSRVPSKWPLPNVWLGVSVENQQAADIRIPDLLETPAALRWVSIEPMLGPMDLELNTCDECGGAGETAGHYFSDDGCEQCETCRGKGTVLDSRLDWVICGGESGPKARPMHPNWARSVRDQCVAAGVPFYFKQWGEWAEPLPGQKFDTSNGRAGKSQAFIVSEDGTVHCFHNEQIRNPKTMVRVGKKAAGRMLDGREYLEMPKTKEA